MPQRFIINPGGKKRRRQNSPHPRSYGSHLPLTYGEGFGGSRKAVTIGKETAAERAAWLRVTSGGGAAAPARSRTSRSTRTTTTKRRKPVSAAQRRARLAFATMSRKRAATARKARSAAGSSTTSRRSGGSMAVRKKRKRRSTTARVSRRRRRPAAKRVGRRRKLRTMVGRVVNPRRRRRRSGRVRSRTRRYRRNPGMGGGIVRQLVQGAKDGFAVTLGRGLTKIVANKVPFGQTSAITQGAIQLLVGFGLAMATRKIVKSERAASFVLAGAFSNVIEKALAPIPVLGPALNGVAAWPRMSGGGAVAAWPRALPAAAAAPSNSRGVGQPWGFDDPNLSDGVFS